MGNSWQQMKKAKEDSYFDRKNREALERLRKQKESEEALLPSPATGEPMEHLLVDGIEVERCPKTGGIWLDGKQVERLKDAADSGGASSGWLSGLLKHIK